MSEEEAVIRRGSYTWHPVYPYLLTLIHDLQGALKFKPTPADLGARASFLKYKKRLKEVAPKIITMRAKGASRKEIAEEIEIGLSTLTKYLKDIREFGLGKC